MTLFYSDFEVTFKNKKNVFKEQQADFLCDWHIQDVLLCPNDAYVNHLRGKCEILGGKVTYFSNACALTSVT